MRPMTSRRASIASARACSTPWAERTSAPCGAGRNGRCDTGGFPGGTMIVGLLSQATNSAARRSSSWPARRTSATSASTPSIGAAEARRSRSRLRAGPAASAVEPEKPWPATSSA